MALLLIGIALAVMACEPKPQDGGYGNLKNRSEVEKMLDKLIDSLKKETDWNTSQLLFSRIEKSVESKDLNLDEKIKGDFHTAAKDAYCYSMDNIMHLMMSGSCGDHTKLEQIWNLRTGKDYGKVNSSLYEEVKKQHKNHQDLLTFINQTKNNRMNVTSFNTAYDVQYETTQKSKASSYLNAKPTCKTIVSELEKIQKGTVFGGRRAAFCQKVVDLYLSKTSWSQGDENIVKSRIKFYTKEHSGDAKVQEWFDAIEEFKNTH